MSNGGNGGRAVIADMQRARGEAAGRGSGGRARNGGVVRFLRGSQGGGGEGGRRADRLPGVRLAGPAVGVEDETATVALEGFDLAIAASGALVLTRRAPA